MNYGNRIIVKSESEFDRIHDKRIVELKGFRDYKVGRLIVLKHEFNGGYAESILWIKDTYYDKVNDITIVKFENNFTKPEKKKTFFQKIKDFFKI